MSEQQNYTPIAATTEDVVAAIRRKTALSLPDDPSAAGLSAATIRRRFWEAICGADASVLSELTRIINEANAALGTFSGELGTVRRIYTTPPTSEARSIESGKQPTVDVSVKEDEGYPVLHFDFSIPEGKEGGKLEAERMAAVAHPLPYGEEPTVSVRLEGSGEDTVLVFDLGIPEGKEGENAVERYALLFGNGKDEEHRSNALQMDWGGNVWFAGNVSSGALEPRNEHDLVTRYYLERTLAARGEVCVLRNDELDPNVTLGNAEDSWSTPAVYTTDIIAPFRGFGGAYVTDGSTLNNNWMFKVKLPSGIDISGSHLVGIWLAVEPTGAGTLSAAVQIELTSSGREDKKEKSFDLKTKDGTLVAGAWRFYVLDLANPKGASPFIGYSDITVGEPDETAINFLRVVGISVTGGRVMVGKCVAIPRHMSVLTGVRGVFADGITVGDVTLTGAQLEKLLDLIK